MYPAFVNCTTIDWFSEWPNDALLEVAEKYLEPMELGDDEVIENFTIINKCFLSAVFFCYNYALFICVFMAIFHRK